MEQCIAQQGICFVLLWLPLALIEKEGIELSFGIAPRIPYLDAVEQYIQTH